MSLSDRLQRVAVELERNRWSYDYSTGACLYNSDKVEMSELLMAAAKELKKHERTH